MLRAIVTNGLDNAGPGPHLGGAVILWFAEPGDSDERVIGAINDGEEWPLVLSRRPAP
jgi:hypothetical protein